MQQQQIQQQQMQQQPEGGKVESYFSPKIVVGGIVVGEVVGHLLDT